VNSTPAYSGHHALNSTLPAPGAHSRHKPARAAPVNEAWTRQIAASSPATIDIEHGIRTRRRSCNWHRPRPAPSCAPPPSAARRRHTRSRRTGVAAGDLAATRLRNFGVSSRPSGTGMPARGICARRYACCRTARAAPARRARRRPQAAGCGARRSTDGGTAPFTTGAG